MDATFSDPVQGKSDTSVHQPLPHDSGVLHATGAARYVDDMPEPPGLLHLAFGQSECTRGQIISMDLDRVRSAPGVVAVLTASDIPGANDVSPHSGDDPLLAEGAVDFHGRPLFIVAATSVLAARRACKLARVEYVEEAPLVTIAQAREAASRIEDTQRMGRGDVDGALARSARQVDGQIEIGGQEHFYLEGQVSVALPLDDGGVLIHSATQHPTEIQHVVARLLGLPLAEVTVDVRRMGGGFGGKETQASSFAAAAALVAAKTGRPAKFRVDRDDDMVLTGKRHDFTASYRVGFDEDGRLQALRVELASRCGATVDMSPAINDRAMAHIDNCYFLPAIEIVSHRYRTNTVSNTAFRGFGGPQGMLVIERVMDDISLELGLAPEEVRKTNLYAPGRDITPYGMVIDEHVAPQIVADLEASSQIAQRRRGIEQFNAANAVLKKGISLTPVKFGIAFTTSHLNQAGALVLVYPDGSIKLNHGGTEMGQGLYIKVAQVVADVFGVGIERINITSTRTDKVPNTSATAASSGSDLNGMAAYNAAMEIRGRMERYLAEEFGVEPSEIVFGRNGVDVAGKVLTFAEVCNSAYLARISLAASGFYRPRALAYDRGRHEGSPFFYFAYGAAVSEVVIDTLTGEHRVLSVDILHDAGRSLNPAIDLGQVEGGFVQGMGWLTTEELVYSSDGRLLTHSPATYKIPTAGDRPRRMKVALWRPEAERNAAIHRSKAVGEPPFMLAISAFSALTHAVRAAVPGKGRVQLNAPATPERILASLRQLRTSA